MDKLLKINLNKIKSKTSIMKLIKLLSIIVFFILATSCEKNTIKPPEKYEITPTVFGLDETYSIEVYLPNGLTMNDVSNNNEMKKMQVLYVLDAEKYAKSVARTVNELQIPVITVGIGYASEDRRNRDYTPTKWQFDDAGGANKFLKFLETDVFSFMETNFYVSEEKNKRYIFGWSLGGLAVTYASLSNTDLFYGHIAVSPSLMWDNQYIFALEEENRLLNKSDTAFIGLYAGSHEFAGMIVAIDAYHERLQLYYSNLTTDYKIFDKRAHNSVVEDAIHHALKVCFF